MRKITRIVTFYDDGTFTESTPSPGYMPSHPAPNSPYPFMPSQPLNPTNQPWTTPDWPQNPWYTVTCKAEDNQPL